MRVCNFTLPIIVFLGAGICCVNAQLAAQWMSGGYGVGLRWPAGWTYPEKCDEDLNYLDCIFVEPNLPFFDDAKIQEFVDQIKSLDGLKWVVINLSRGAYGDTWLAWHSVLTNLNPGSTPPIGVDFVERIADALHANGFKVIAYVAAQGPAMLKQGGKSAFDRGIYTNNDRYDEECDCTPYMKNWSDHVASIYGNSDRETLMNAFADIIMDEYAARYGDKIDGWWFDQGAHANNTRLSETVRRHNPNVVAAFNYGQHVPLVNNLPGIEDYTSGHPNPVKLTPPSSMDNYPMLTSIENTIDGFLEAEGEKSLGHMFMPLCETWNGIGTSRVWNESQAVEWMARATDANGAWTWNIPRNSHDKETFHLFNLEHIEFIKNVLEGIQNI